jgi:hypothetical protein
MANFRAGETTLQDVVTALGPASLETALDDGSTLLVYTYVTSRPHPESYLPFIGSLIAGSDTHSSAAVFLFDRSGILKSANTTSSNVGTGLTAGAHTGPHAAPTRSAEPHVVVKSVQPPAVQSVEPIPEGNAAPAPQTPANAQPEFRVEPIPVD